MKRPLGEIAAVPTLPEVTELGLRPTTWHLTLLATKLGAMRTSRMKMIMLAYLPEWKRELDCRTENVVGIIEYLVETKHPLMLGFGLDMHLIDAIMQCRLRRQGLYSREEWTGIPDR